MCGRGSHRLTWAQIHALLSMTGPLHFLFPDEDPPASYNVAPTQMSPIVRRSTVENGACEGVMARWGLIPSWAKDVKIGSRLINARGETVAAQPAFRSAYRSRRCLVLFSGFFEWQPSVAATHKQPWYITRADEHPLAIAGLWERWGNGSMSIDSFAVVTTSANAFMASIHNRMPVVLEPESTMRWLNPQLTPAELETLIAPAPDGVLTARRVSTRVNRPANNDPACIAPVD
jgi:putative SOS response-associated peptidase YedK